MPRTTVFRKSLKILRHISLYGIIFPYTSYAFYVSLKTNWEITKRKDDHTILKYTPLKICGRYENPFEEYRIQTVYEFFINRIIELFETNRGGIPIDQARMNTLMPIHKPTWTTTTSVNGVNTSKEILSDPIDSITLMDTFALSKNKDSTRSTANLDVTWLGQSCSFILYNNSLKILTDPLFTNFLISPKFGPKRITKLPCSIEDVPQPDIILVSHNHPDHLDELSLKTWANKENVTWIVPKGLGTFLKKNYDIKNYIELSWWQSAKITTKNLHKTYFVHCTPAMHWSGRSLLDSNESLWCTFLVKEQGCSQNFLFHGGDTGYVKDLFKMIRARYGDVKLAILPCGQYCPQWHQKPRHINPTEVLNIMKDLHAQNVLGVHWGTFVLSGEYFREPKEKLEFLAEWEGVSQNCYCPELGNTQQF
ncbi:related to N-acyl-phosphatidylethanolamine-hydrolyzing phospholipase D, mitochondrial [Saccharomycodes ludwigii]|uniref:Related to N-acyl-phosphatidylethanolamine-hydrolyzing phospholipase D, mitochondrial n=1 Tax=Saccharomycodes ludwigii TaxID=36035 RepID=A0A376B6Z8_9ASCO|nr:hypothetical protein SCDLUD_002053 [Saccharomycodes ludwigii]KAH3902236.1 hypothetical protein SCDLUD_002053 [Saccharomycodes ludwigii]SSD60422.1 related to N-acyl-phosphatidylethanolamine-hydrolyzing phospholipase D, mitochondrial [Saccharomycodes ludwigii]